MGACQSVCEFMYSGVWEHVLGLWGGRGDSFVIVA